MPHASPFYGANRRRRIHTALGAGTVAVLLGCGSYANIDRSLDDHPVTNTGVAATILMPGQTGVPMPSTSPHAGLGAPAPGAPNASGSASSATTGAPSGGGMTMIGGTTQDIEKHQKVNNEPAWAKATKLPFLIAAYPFKKAHQAVTGPADPSVKVSGPPAPAPPTAAQRQAARERSLLEGMERELASQGAAPESASVPTPTPGVAAPPRPAGPGGTPSIAAELAALRRAVLAPRTAPAPEEIATPAPSAPPPERLYESVDRDADGRPDRWIYRQGQAVVAEATDDDGDGLPERKVRYATGSDQPVSEEEDTNADGRVDIFTEYEAGRVVRRRADADGDGEIDTWSFYRDGELLRHEQDSNGDGFRDRMSFYEQGRLIREEEDRDGNGRPDRVTYYDEHERMARQEEDTNGDDTMDIRSFYREGKLRRRELIR